MPCQTTSVSSRPRIFGFWRERSIPVLSARPHDPRWPSQLYKCGRSSRVSAFAGLMTKSVGETKRAQSDLITTASSPERDGKRMKNIPLPGKGAVREPMDMLLCASQNETRYWPKNLKSISNGHCFRALASVSGMPKTQCTCAAPASLLRRSPRR